MFDKHGPTTTRVEVVSQFFQKLAVTRDFPAVTFSHVHITSELYIHTHTPAPNALDAKETFGWLWPDRKYDTPPSTRGKSTSTDSGAFDHLRKEIRCNNTNDSPWPLARKREEQRPKQTRHQHQKGQVDSSDTEHAERVDVCVC